MARRARSGFEATAGRWELGVLSPWDGHHLPVARQLRRRLREAGFGVEGWFADRLALAGLLAQLARGPALAIYLGHGSPWGLDAFGGVGLAKIGASKPWRSCGSLALLACRTAAPRGSAPGFATMLQAEGRVLSCLAAVADVEQATNAALARRLVGALADGARSLGECLVRLDRELGLGIHAGARCGRIDCSGCRSNP
ncbi:MAG: hypothetical protein M5U12_23905 [Verrucomicrobia bacterium]|nr:hypothetical protein [Verrucomicrobiota bacterium]